MTETKRNGERLKVLIAYASKKGTTAKIAQYISEGMPEADVDVLDVADVQSFDYDLVALGAPVRLGGIHPSMIAFLKENKQKLSETPKALFVVCLFTFLGRHYLKKMKQHTDGKTVSYRAFGGKFGFLNMLDEEYAKEVGRSLKSRWEQI